MDTASQEAHADTLRASQLFHTPVGPSGKISVDTPTTGTQQFSPILQPLAA